MFFWSYKNWPTTLALGLFEFWECWILLDVTKDCIFTLLQRYEILNPGERIESYTGMEKVFKNGTLNIHYIKSSCFLFVWEKGASNIKHPYFTSKRNIWSWSLKFHQGFQKEFVISRCVLYLTPWWQGVLTTWTFLFWPCLLFLFIAVWADNADACSVQYAGTGALKTDFTRYESHV